MKYIFNYRSAELKNKFQHWEEFLKNSIDKAPANASSLQIQIRFDCEIPSFIDQEGRIFKIDFENDKANYQKTKSSLTKEPLARALGSGKFGSRLLDMTAGLGVDSVFLAQLGFHVVAVERNPLVYMALAIATEFNSQDWKERIHFQFGSALNVLENNSNEFDIGYFDPMFPAKKKSALPKQEMVFFKNLVGSDDDANSIVQQIVSAKLFKRFVVKRPVGADSFVKPNGQIEGKIIRYDIYGN